MLKLAYYDVGLSIFSLQELLMKKSNDTFKRLRAVMKDVNGDHRQIIKTMQDQIDYLMEFIDIQGEILEEKTGNFPMTRKSGWLTEAKS